MESMPVKYRASTDTTVGTPRPKPNAGEWRQAVRNAGNHSWITTADPKQYLPRMRTFFQAIETLAAAEDRQTALNYLGALRNYMTGVYRRNTQPDDHVRHAVAERILDTIDRYKAVLSNDDTLSSDVLHLARAPGLDYLQGKVDVWLGMDAHENLLATHRSHQTDAATMEATLSRAFQSMIDANQVPAPPSFQGNALFAPPPDSGNADPKNLIGLSPAEIRAHLGHPDHGAPPDEIPLQLDHEPVIPEAEK
jgi:hypothetical protein